MNFLRKLFGGNKRDRTPRHIDGPSSNVDPADDPNMIKMFDGYGREVFINKQEWREKLLPGNLEKVRDHPEQLHNMLVIALQDGFAADVIPYAEHLRRTDPIPSRGAVILGVAYMEAGRLAEAQRVFEDFLASHGEDGVILTNLAKVYHRNGNEARAEAILWHALEVDPNQSNCLGWYVAIQRERGGEAAAIEAYRRVSDLPRSWRAQLWLAHDALQNKNLAAAETLYAQVLARTEKPVPSDLLMQLSGDLGNHGYLVEAIRLVEPYFDSTFHGLLVGNNLIQAHNALGQVDSARLILNQLYAQKRPDWHKRLNYLDAELTKAEIAKQEDTPPEQFSLSLLSIEGPLWTRDGSSFAALLQSKRTNAQRIAIIGSTVIFAEAPDKFVSQLSDHPGRLSRAVPLFLTEKVHLATDAVGYTLIPWVQDQGFAVFSHPYSDQDLCDLISNGDEAPNYVIGVTIDASRTTWNVRLRMIRRIDGQRIAEAEVEAAFENPGPAIEQLAEDLIRLMDKHMIAETSPAPSWYRLPAGSDFSDYLLRIEQQLAVAAMHFEFLKGGGLSGEREILGGILELCVRQPENLLVRMVFAQTIRQMQMVRPEIISEYKERIALLQHEYPLKGDVWQLIEKTVEKVVGD